MCAPIKDLPLDSKPLISVIRPTAIPPCGLLAIAKSNIVEPVDINSLISVGVVSCPSKKYATFISVNVLFKLSANTFANSSLTDIFSPISFTYQKVR